MFYLLLIVATLLVVTVLMRFNFYKAYLPIVTVSLSRFTDSIAAIIYSIYYEYKGIPIYVGQPSLAAAGSAIHVVLSEDNSKVALALTTNGMSEIIAITPDLYGKESPVTILGIPVVVLSLLGTDEEYTKLLDKESANLHGKLIVLIIKPSTMAGVPLESYRVIVKHKFSEAMVSIVDQPAVDPANTDN